MRRALALAIVLGIRTTAAAEPTVVDRAAALFERAQTHYQAGQYRAAIQLFDEAYGLVHDPIYLFNLAQTYRKVLDCVNASTYYRRYLAEATDADLQQRTKVEQWVRELAPCVDQRERERDAAARGEQAERQRRADDERRQLAASNARFLDVDHGRRYRFAGLAVGGVGVIAGGFAVGYAVRGSRLASELATACSDGCDWTPELEAKDRAGDRANTLSAVSWIAGGAAVAGGVVLYVMGRNRPIEHVQITPTSGGAAVTARGSF
jgi:tetratricopeptide (TPR) repeat protein